MFRTFLQASIVFLGWIAFELVLFLAAPAHATSGGPDSFGITWADSDGAGPTYDYEYGSDVHEFSSNDGSFELTMPFAIQLWEVPENTVTVHAQGAITMWGSSLDASSA
ncbi:MAG: hypothetical protein GY898_25940 [Proteobacteria bacterium]|nr:hypothetical protein [Pseudomonadota bacterium]